MSQNPNPAESACNAGAAQAAVASQPGDAPSAATAAAPLLEVRDLRAGYGRAQVLDGLDFAAPKGGVATIIGPNGAGKSTTLNALVGAIPSRGGIVFDGQDIGRASLEERVMLGIALVPERRELFGTMTVEDNLLLGGWRQMRRKFPKWRERIDEVYARFPRLKERRAQLAGTLSGGERQMLAVGRALMSAPRLLMLDEPSLGLAPLVTREIFTIIEGLRATGVTILLVEQNARAALAVADHGYVLETGQFALHGPAAELANDPRVIDTYLGTGHGSVAPPAPAPAPRPPLAGLATAPA
ncbi:ABC transporter ATP-binding protein [Derxia gummosa]|uniref:ABC transporter ATP-binding protein n=1 Tax=Derxia gummosa DSM 723 TaxID=1121388 RepID=A0A8B6XB29_9BURK|nr:ABC transporter ATP-binding protein [Derxia gummosa]